MMPFPSDVGVAIVCHNSRAKLAPTIASLDWAGCPRAAIRVFDVGSTDGTVEWFATAFSDVGIVQLRRNEGPNPARNLAIRECPFPFLFLMDADVRVQPQTVQRLRAVMQSDPTIKIGSPIVVHLESPDRIQYAGTNLHFICEAINPWLNRTLAERGSEAIDIGVAAASGLLLDRQASVDVGLFDERYFMGKDDGDFTHRMRMAGHRIRELPDAIVLHDHQKGRSSWLFHYQIRNRWHFMLKNYQWRTLVLMIPCLAVHEPLQLLLLHLKGHARAYWRAVAGLLAMLPSVPRDRAFTRGIRRVPDVALLRSDRLILRDDLASNAFMRTLQAGYETFLRGYWRLIS
jgi:N-acetylglucosaminyl-diphospho-decaprenol L-rhamnosyltransferase